MCKIKLWLFRRDIFTRTYITPLALGFQIPALKQATHLPLNQENQLLVKS